jgi:DNA modification methylase
MNYDEFIQSKQKTHVNSGFDAECKYDYLFPFQQFVASKSLKAGKYGIFSGTGTGKSRMQLTWANEVKKHTGLPVLVLAPLVVGSQTKAEAEKIGVELENIHIINYEQLENIDASIYGGIALDEGSIIKNHEGAYRNLIIDNFKLTPYKSIWSATPAPNDPMEIGNYSEFLDVMPRNEMLAMYFVHDGGETSKWRLKKHAEKIFWHWVSTWAVMFQHPRDIGFEQDGYDLPPLNLLEKQIITSKRDNGSLYNDHAVSATTFNAELRATMKERLDLAISIVEQDKEQYIIWVNQNEEGEYLRKRIPDAVEVKGSDKNEDKESNLLAFANAKIRVLITKTKIAGYGMNFQSCHNQVFASLDFSFEKVYQAIRRSLRFGQKFGVNVWLITTDTMQNVIQTYYKKQEQFIKMQTEMTNAVNLDTETVEINCDPVTNEYYQIKQGDSVKLITTLADESIGLSVFSPPFADLYTYSDNVEDMGNSKDYKEFLTQFSFLIKELYRVMMQGRNVAVHCMDLPIQKGKEGFIGLRDFSGMILRAFEDAGFVYASRVTIWKDPVVEMQRTKALGLLHKQIKKDSTMSRVGIPDYVMIFRKDGERTNPVTNKDLPVDLWQKYASPVWMDIDYGNTLQGYRNGRDDNDEKHICPLQLDTIERLVHLYTNKGDTVFTPFMGIGSEVYQAVKMGRTAIGFELKESYFDLAKKNLSTCIEQKKQLTLI